jgi:hypothetical protein
MASLMAFGGMAYLLPLRDGFVVPVITGTLPPFGRGGA